MLTAEELRKLLHYDPHTGVFTWLVSLNSRAQAGGVIGSLDGRGYVQVQINKHAYKLHRLAWLYMTGDWPSRQIDHINRIRTDNRWCNIREATGSENQQNRGVQKNNTSGVRGVCPSSPPGKWCAFIKVARKSQYIGTYNTLDEAKAARLAAEEKLHPFRPVSDRV